MILTLLWVAVIFSFSFQPADASSHMSSSVLQKLFAWLLDSMSQEQLDFWHTVLRKCAHFAEFFILGLLVTTTLLEIKGKLLVLLAIALCVCVASVDETIQLFVDGRSGRVVDVLLDSVGSIVGISIRAFLNRNSK